MAVYIRENSKLRWVDNSYKSDLLHSVKYPSFKSIKHLEGKGNFAVSKYYKWPFRPFYRHKLKMIVDMIGDDKFQRILDFGSGSGIFRQELLRHAKSVSCIDIDTTINPHWRFDAIICASVLEFTHLYPTVDTLYNLLSPGGVLYVASPMDTKLSRAYYKLIKDDNYRHSHKTIKSVLEAKFNIKEHKEWMGLYFALKAFKR